MATACIKKLAKSESSDLALNESGLMGLGLELWDSAESHVTHTRP